MKKAIFYGIGVGPGDPELMTIKAVRILKDADVIGIPVSERIGSSSSADSTKEHSSASSAAGPGLYASPGHGCTAFHIACQAVPELAQKESCRLVFPMTRDAGKREAAFRANADRVLSYLAAGKSVAFPVLGDPSIYSTYTYVSRLVADAGYPTEMIPGIPSFCAAAAAAGQSLGEDDMQIHIFPVLPSHGSGNEPAPTSTDSLLSLPGRKILMKGGRFSGQLRDVLLSENIPAVMVENCGMETEKIYRSPEEFPEQAGYYSIILV